MLDVKARCGNPHVHCLGKQCGWYKRSGCNGTANTLVCLRTRLLSEDGFSGRHVSYQVRADSQVYSYDIAQALSMGRPRSMTDAAYDAQIAATRPGQDACKSGPLSSANDRSRATRVSKSLPHTDESIAFLA